MLLIGRITRVREGLVAAGYDLAEHDISIATPSGPDQPFLTEEQAFAWLQSEADRLNAGLVLEVVEGGRPR